MNDAPLAQKTALKYAPIIWSGLSRKPFRTVLTFLSVTTAFLLYGGLSGTLASFDQFMNEFFDESRLYTLSRLSPGLPLPSAYVQQIERIPGVRSTHAQVSFDAWYQRPENNFGGEAFDVVQRRKAGTNDYIVSEAAWEAMLRTRSGVLVGSELARRFGWKVGDQVPLYLTTLRKDRSNVWLFDIVGTWDVPPNSGRGGDQIWVNYDYYDESRAVNGGTVSAILTQVDDPAHAERVTEEIDRLFANSGAETQTQSIAAAMRAEINQILDIRLMINAVLTAVFFTLLFVTGNTMVQSVRERIPEFGVLKACGFQDVIVSGLVLAEALVLCVFAALAGILLASELLFPFIFASFSMDPLPMAPGVIAKSMVFAVALALVTALAPALRAGRLSVIDALAAKGK